MLMSIENEYLTAKINETSGELYSLISKKTGREYIWQGNPEFWDRRSPVLFPVCGRMYKGKYVCDGKEYEMPLHGLTFEGEFKSCSISDNQADFTLISDENTKKLYPFDFEFTVSYALKKKSLVVTYIVKNSGNKDMPFSYGAHPAFNVPFNDKEKFEDYYVEFKKKSFKRLTISENGLIIPKIQNFWLSDGKFHLTHEAFDEDWFFESKNGKVNLKSSLSADYLQVKYKNTVCLGLWQTSKKPTPFICIEPWHGTPAEEGKTDDLKRKAHTITLKSDKTYKNSYSIIIKEF